MDENTDLDVEETEEAELSLSDDLAAAWDNSDDTETVEETETDGDVDETVAEPEVAELETETVEAKDETEEPDAPDVDQAPVGLPPEAREAWKDTPKAVKEAMAKREIDFATGMQKNAEGAKRAQQMDQTLAPYQQYFAMNGGPAASLQNLLQAGAGLQMGTPNQKAELIAGLINQFGVDITALDAVLVGKPPAAEAQQSSEVQQQIDTALEPYKQQQAQQQQQQQQAQQAQQQTISDEVTAFSADPQNEFYNDLKGDMADILDLAANRGKPMTMAQAYNTAKQLRPDILKIEQGRVSAESVAAKLRASSTISGNRGGEGGSAQHGTTRAAIEDAWDNAGRM